MKDLPQNVSWERQPMLTSSFHMYQHTHALCMYTCMIYIHTAVHMHCTNTTHKVTKSFAKATHLYQLGASVQGSWKFPPGASAHMIKSCASDVQMKKASSISCLYARISPPPSLPMRWLSKYLNLSVPWFPSAAGRRYWPPLPSN